MPQISAYTAATAVTDDDVFPFNDASTTKKVTALIAKAYFAGSSPSKTVSTTTYTLVATDKGQTLKFTNAAAVAVTVPSSVLAAGDIVGWEQWGTGAVTFAGGATLRSLGNLLSSAGQYSAGSIRFDTATEALVAGALA